MASVKFKNQYQPHQPRKFATKIVGDSMTQQQFKKECDVNNVLAKYKKTGLLTHISRHQGNFGDFSNIDDYQMSLEKLNTAQRSFNSLPSEIRAQFNNDPGKLIDFLADKKNDEQAIKLGLKTKPKHEPSIQQQMEKALEANDNRRKKEPSKKTE